ncbi:MAG: toprim domain-containing protein [Candidatus Obscuribacterales bacterium]|nr:toprim domain-containing protein [Candidatus Obscuribacterales bacterium]
MHCWSGCDGGQVLREISKIMELPDKVISLKRTTPAPNTTTPCVWVKSLWHNARTIVQGDLAARYFQARGITLERFPDSLRFAPTCKITGEANLISLPAVLARFDDRDGRLSTVHRIYLQEPGRKADVDRPKRICSSPAKGGAIRLFEPAKVIGIAEGIETALACFVDTGIPTWATYSSSLMPFVTLPERIESVVIFGDNDLSGAGQKAATQLQTRLLKEGKSVQMLIPPEQGRDWLDVLNDDTERGLV